MNRHPVRTNRGQAIFVEYLHIYSVYETKDREEVTDVKGYA